MGQYLKGRSMKWEVVELQIKHTNVLPLLSNRYVGFPSVLCMIVLTVLDIYLIVCYNTTCKELNFITPQKAMCSLFIAFQ